MLFDTNGYGTIYVLFIISLRWQLFLSFLSKKILDLIYVELFTPFKFNIKRLYLTVYLTPSVL